MLQHCFLDLRILTNSSFDKGFIQPSLLSLLLRSCLLFSCPVHHPTIPTYWFWVILLVLFLQLEFVRYWYSWVFGQQPTNFAVTKKKTDLMETEVGGCSWLPNLYWVFFYKKKNDLILCRSVVSRGHNVRQPIRSWQWGGAPNIQTLHKVSSFRGALGGIWFYQALANHTH